MRGRMPKIATVAIPFAVAFGLAISGCGDSEQPTTSAEGFGQLSPGKVRKAAASNAHKEIPTQFGRAISLPSFGTVIYAKAIDVVDPLAEARPNGKNAHEVGVLIGLRNIGTRGWTGSVAQLSRLAVGPDGKPEGVIDSLGSLAGPCPGPLIKTKAPVSDKPASLAAGRTAFECVRFRLQRHENPILFKFAVRANDYTLGAEQNGRGYAVWALPGTLVEKCRFEPSAVAEGRCQGLEDDEG